MCICENAVTKHEKCCLCIPIKWGVEAIATLVILIAVAQFCEILGQLQNDNIDWWYFAVGSVVSVPVLNAFCRSVGFLATGDHFGRIYDMHTTSVRLMTSVTLLAVWNAYYYT
jgi:hypothetical protein